MNNFQLWLISQGYYRENDNGAWMKDNKILSGRELFDLLNEYKNK